MLHRQQFPFPSPSLLPPSLPMEAGDSVEAIDAASPGPVRGHRSREVEESEVDPGAEPVLHFA